MKILYAVSECRPFCASGGLADVAGSLPQAIKRKSGDDVRVILPLYPQIEKSYSDKLKLVGEAEVQLDWRVQKCQLFTLTKDSVKYYFVKEDYYFDREKLYGYDDDIERFAFFSSCVVSLRKLMKFTPDVICCNDWQTSFVPAYVKNAKLNIKTMLTIHNIEYQGRFSIQHLRDLTGLMDDFKGYFEWNGWGNALKGGIIACDMLVTVSPTYANEILNPFFSAGLSPVIEQNRYKLFGVLNGIDTQAYNSVTDKSICANFSVEDLSGKDKCKQNLQKQLGLPLDKNAPIFAMVTRFAEHKGLKLVEEALPALLQNNKMQFVILGTGDYHYESHFNYLSTVYNNVATRVGFDTDLAKSIYAGADFFIMPSLSEPCGLAQMIACRYATLPIVRGVGGLFDSIKDGLNGLVFFDFNRDALEWAVNRAVDLYKDAEQFKQMRLNALSSDFSWDVSATKYIQLLGTMVK